MRFPAAPEPHLTTHPMVPVPQDARIMVPAAQEPDGPRFPAYLAQLDPDQRVREIGEW